MKTHTNLILTLICTATASANTIIDFVTVGNPGNANDTVANFFDGPSGHGGVGYSYQIGKYEVTLNQYSAFLNAVAAADPNGLYNTQMGTKLNIAGIVRFGIDGAYTYAVVGDGQRPVTYVSFLDAMRFANWVNNGQGGGSTETGAYTLALGGLATRNAGANVFIPSVDEWYKAAYYDPTRGGSNYWKYATRSDSAPGNVVGAGTNQANYLNGVYSVTQSSGLSTTQNYLTPVGAFTSSESHYGTFDQNGNVWEWNDTVYGSNRAHSGSSWFSSLGASYLSSSYRSASTPESELNEIGFRIATVVPEPTAVVSLILTGSLLFSWRKRPRRALKV
jgi:sulfatase modifying factor 1